MGFYSEQIVPRLIQCFMSGKKFGEVRQEALKTAAGTVLEVGFGSGLNLSFYPTSVARILALEPSLVARHIAQKRIQKSSIPVEFIGLDGEQIPLPDCSVDHVVSTWTLCTIPNPERALREIKRVLKPAGCFIFVEHGLAPGKTADWQRRLTPIQKRLVAGCHLDRPIRSLIEGAGLGIDKMENFYMEGPKMLSYLYVGNARSASRTVRQ